MDLYSKIKHQRREIDAPVDTIGCASAGAGLEAEEKKFQILIALLLSSQTKDEVTHEATQLLNKRLGGLSPLKVCNASPDVIHGCIKKVGYHNKKLKYLISISHRLRGTELPETLEEVLKLPGIGRKMAYLYLQHACNINSGIGVDTHVYRISKRIGLSSASTPEGVRHDLERALEKDEWVNVNQVFVGFGQKVCLSVHPKCEMCCVREECPSSTFK